MKTLRYLLFILPVILSVGCTHNNGDIGPLFGQWIMTDITADGTRPADITPTDWNWRFQSGVLLISHVDYLAHEHHEYWASWEKDGESLLINYQNTQDGYDFYYDIPAQIGFTTPSHYKLDILQSSSKNMTLQMVNSDGVTYVYTLKKN